MKYVVSTVLVVLAVVIGIGFYQQWWSVNAESDGTADKRTVDLNLTIDTDKASKDLKEAGKATNEAVESAGESISNLADKAREAVGNPTGDKLKGTVSSVDDQNRSLTIETGAESVSFVVAEDVDIVDEEANVKTLNNITKGDKITVTYTEEDGKKIANDIEFIETGEPSEPSPQ